MSCECRHNIDCMSAADIGPMCSRVAHPTLGRYHQPMSGRYRIQYRADIKCLLGVDFGEPGQAVQTGVRGKISIVPTTPTLAALDHDQQSKASLTTSVCLNVSVPNAKDGSFYRGNETVSYTDSVFESSSPIRHATELEEIITKSEVKQVLIII